MVVKHSDVMTTPRTMIQRVIAGLVGTAAIVLVAGCSVSVGSEGSDSISKPEDAAIGSCVSIGDKAGKGGKIDIEKADCNTTDRLTFTAASVVPAEQDCGNPNLSHVTFAGSSGKLCIASNFEAGSCYQVPSGKGASLADYRKVECSAAPKRGSIIYRVASRTDTAATCPTGQLAVNYTAPKTIGYCVEKIG